MKLEELYQKIGGDRKDVMKRNPNEAMLGLQRSEGDRGGHRKARLI